MWKVWNEFNCRITFMACKQLPSPEAGQVLHGYSTNRHTCFINDGERSCCFSAGSKRNFQGQNSYQPHITRNETLVQFKKRCCCILLKSTCPSRTFGSSFELSRFSISSTDWTDSKARTASEDSRRDVWTGQWRIFHITLFLSQTLTRWRIYQCMKR